MLGIGLTYIDSRLRRRWLYPTAFVYAGLAFFDYSVYGHLEYIFGYDFFMATLFFAFGLFILGFFDVLLTVHVILRGAKPVPDALRWWKAIGLHLCFGFGLAYVDSSIRRKWLYPISFSGAIALLLATGGDVIYYLDELPGILFLVFSSIYIIGFIDIVISCRSQLKTNP